VEMLGRVGDQWEKPITTSAVEEADLACWYHAPPRLGCTPALPPAYLTQDPWLWVIGPWVVPVPKLAKLKVGLWPVQPCLDDAN
jgi:hypothetical protein